MRQRQAGLVEDHAVHEEEVEVDRARAEAWALAPDAAEPALDLQQPPEKLGWRQLGVELGDAVQKPRLVLVADRIRLPQRRDRDHLDPLLGAQQLERGGDQRRWVAKVGPESDESPRHPAIVSERRPLDPATVCGSCGY